MVANFPWLNEIDTLLLGFCESISQQCIESTHIFTAPRSMQNESASTSESSCHSLAFTWCCLEEVQRALWTNHRSIRWFPLLKPTTVLQITFLEDVLPVTNGLCPLLQSNKKAFGVISRAANLMLMILEEIKEDVDSVLLKSFTQSEDITKRVSLNEMGSTVAGGTRKQSRIDA